MTLSVVWGLKTGFWAPASGGCCVDGLMMFCFSMIWTSWSSCLGVAPLVCTKAGGTLMGAVSTWSSWSTSARVEGMVLISMGPDFLFLLQQNCPRVHLNPTNLASGTGTSQCWSGRAQPQDFGSTIFIRFWIFFTLIPELRGRLVRSRAWLMPRYRRKKNNPWLIIAEGWWLTGDDGTGSKLTLRHHRVLSVAGGCLWCERWLSCQVRTINCFVYIIIMLGLSRVNRLKSGPFGYFQGSTTILLFKEIFLEFANHRVPDVNACIKSQ